MTRKSSSNQLFFFPSTICYNSVSLVLCEHSQYRFLQQCENEIKVVKKRSIVDSLCVQSLFEPRILWKVCRNWTEPQSKTKGDARCARSTCQRGECSRVMVCEPQLRSWVAFSSRPAWRPGCPTGVSPRSGLPCHNHSCSKIPCWKFSRTTSLHLRPCRSMCTSDW